MVNFLDSDLKSKYNNSRRQNWCKYLKKGKDQNEDLIVDDDAQKA